jgi:hypothetical protein
MNTGSVSGSQIEDIVLLSSPSPTRFLAKEVDVFAHYGLKPETRF